ncbi:hypothetical protein TSAR_006641 [Trichomalopsis sarcophagae]|uniref:Uncharacterized protein n=1 Tax=Trichomalopsis sarcophagae TaxID=543379 RepID=A0A232EXS8_9HYME|nr:hypothetical protein TSAR_006641 [Trichomalopsis sarcophagae]
MHFNKNLQYTSFSILFILSNAGHPTKKRIKKLKSLLHKKY